MAFITVVIIILYFPDWETIEVPLSQGAGRLAFERMGTHPFLAEHDYRIRIDLADGGTIKSDIRGNFGGRTLVYLAWMPRRNGKGPFLLLDDRYETTWVNLGKQCLFDHSKPEEVIPEDMRCAWEDLPQAINWRYFGRIEERGKGMEFLETTSFPPPGDGDDRHIKVDLPVPDGKWSALFAKRPCRPGSVLDYWIRLRGPESFQTDACFRGGMIPQGKVPVTWFPAEDSQGPFILIGTLNATLIDIVQRSVFRVFRASEFSFRNDEKVGNAVGMMPDAMLQSGYVTYRKDTDSLTFQADDEKKRSLIPLPDIVSKNRGVRLGFFQLESNLDFAPAQ